MNSNLIFWFYAYAVTVCALVFAFRGVGRAKKGQLEAHRKDMIRACNLIILFVLSYVFKVLFLGREDKSSWESTYLWILYIHEALIGLMLVTGVWARILAAKLATTLTDPNPSDMILTLRRKHAKIGRTCIIAAVCALFTAAIILYGMWQRQS